MRSDRGKSSSTHRRFRSLRSLHTISALDSGYYCRLAHLRLLCSNRGTTKRVEYTCPGNRIVLDPGVFWVFSQECAREDDVPIRPLGASGITSSNQQEIPEIHEETA